MTKTIQSLYKWNLSYCLGCKIKFEVVGSTKKKEKERKRNLNYIIILILFRVLAENNLIKFSKAAIQIFYLIAHNLRMSLCFYIAGVNVKNGIY